MPQSMPSLSVMDVALRDTERHETFKALVNHSQTGSCPESTTPVTEESMAVYYIQNIPLEILDQIIPFLDAKTLVSVCHAIPALKHISYIMHKVGTSLSLSLNRIWPTFWLPVEWHSYSDQPDLLLPGAPITLSPEQLENVGELMRLISIYGGVVKFQAHSLEYTEALLPHLPRSLEVYIGGEAASNMYCGYMGIDPYFKVLELLAEQGIRFRQLDTPWRFGAESTRTLWKEFKAPFLRCFGVEWVPTEVLQECVHLRQIEFDIDDNDDKESFDKLMQVLSKISHLERLSFEIGEPKETWLDKLQGFQDEEQLEKLGWKSSELEHGPIYGHTTIVWTRTQKGKLF
ncbi:hypothetical protein BCR33DRAFT_711879 [Rhizoclosmatium globosum]|uniref:F-box domain-containing protein n=1 Tax=Rhizoclosmatium globosum TaxID=329046 RepID=A0A1Y2D006_9FUNG|nr:hypothetical protein BCR33DRAFT_711879 [Rhizoclosmatium globosum]|eukprot:ORY52613.1 hypothetical protein BCR33DRAFT_711879 [Rhizoclosmatium globosum]